MIIIPIKWLFHWEYTLFSDKPKWMASGVSRVPRACHGPDSMRLVGQLWASPLNPGEDVCEPLELQLFGVRWCGRVGKPGTCHGQSHKSCLRLWFLLDGSETILIDGIFQQTCKQSLWCMRQAHFGSFKNSIRHAQLRVSSCWIHCPLSPTFNSFWIIQLSVVQPSGKTLVARFCTPAARRAVRELGWSSCGTRWEPRARAKKSFHFGHVWIRGSEMLGVALKIIPKISQVIQDVFSFWWFSLLIHGGNHYSPRAISDFAFAEVLKAEPRWAWGPMHSHIHTHTYMYVCMLAYIHIFIYTVYMPAWAGQYGSTASGVKICCNTLQIVPNWLKVRCQLEKQNSAFGDMRGNWRWFSAHVGYCI